MCGLRTIVLGWRNKKSWIIAGYRSPMACVWLNEGRADDLRRARRYAKAEGYRVFVFPITEPFPLRTARAML